MTTRPPKPSVLLARERLNPVRKQIVSLSSAVNLPGGACGRRRRPGRNVFLVLVLGLRSQTVGSPEVRSGPGMGSASEKELSGSTVSFQNEPFVKSVPKEGSSL